LRIRAAVRAGRPIEIPVAVEVRSSPGLLEPGVVGLWRPILLLPAGIEQRLTPPQLEAVLAHELCHVRRRDNLTAAAHMAVEAVFWFHPLVWWIGARLVDERERACDEAVLSLGSQPRIYADAILNVCRLYVESPLVCVPGVTGADLKRRIEAIMTNRTGHGLNRAKKFLLAGAGIAALTVPIVIGGLIGLGKPPAIRAQSPVAAPPAPGPYEGRRLTAMLIDFSAMTAGQQSSVRQAAMDYVRGKMQPADLLAILVVDNGRIKVVHDFTDDHAVLESAIANPTAVEGNSFPSGAGLRLTNIQAAARLLGSIPGKKSLLYFSSRAELLGANPEELQDAIQTAKQSNVALVPRSAPLATYDGQPDIPASLVDALHRESRESAGPAAAPIAGLPGRHASVQIYPDKDVFSPDRQRCGLSVPLDSFAGQVDILGEIVAAEGAAEENVRDSVQASARTWEADFMLKAGSYVCRLIVREQATGRIYGETINFEVK
jgi:BlaR1 peptidase M56